LQMLTRVTAVEGDGQERLLTFFLLWCFVLLGAVSAVSAPLPKTKDDGEQGLLVHFDVPEADVLKAVQEVTQDQIIHGTYSYEKERILYGAHSANSAGVFGGWPGPGKAFYKVANKVLSPRFFKDSEDIGTITVRYVVKEAGPGATAVQIDAVFVDARNVRHPSTGNVESSEYAAIQAHLKNIQASRKETQGAAAETAAKRALSSAQQPAGSPYAEPASDSSTPGWSVQELQARVRALRHQVELRVKDSGASLKSAPFRSSATILSLPEQTEVLIVVLTPYWYGVETEDGHHGWIHHSQLEPLP
jgi:hypothetical protein